VASKGRRRPIHPSDIRRRCVASKTAVTLPRPFAIRPFATHPLK
jgi:hypothetical protein